MVLIAEEISTLDKFAASGVAVVKENEVVESGTLWVGIPAKQVKDNMVHAYETNLRWAEKYSRLAEVHGANS